MEHDVFFGTERGNQVEGLKNKTNFFAAQFGELFVVQRRKISVADEYIASGERIEPGYAMHERGLARATWPHDCGELTLFETYVDVVEGANFAVARTVDLAGPDGTRRNVQRVGE